MKVITIIEDGERARSVYVRPDGDVTVFDRDRKFRFRTDISGAETTWQLLERVVPAIAHAESCTGGIRLGEQACRRRH
jgi:ribosome biogenesis protein Tsr3